MFRSAVDDAAGFKQLGSRYLNETLQALHLNVVSIVFMALHTMDTFVYAASLCSTLMVNLTYVRL